MRWDDRDRYFQKSKDGCYSVCAIGYAQGEWFYEAWRTRAHAEGPHLISTNLESAEAARAACEADAGDAPQPVQPRVKETRKKSNAWSDVHGG